MISAIQKLPFVDAHYNLSRLYELIGQYTEALKHLKTYRSLLDPSSPLRRLVSMLCEGCRILCSNSH